MGTYKGVRGKISIISDNEVDWTIENFRSFSTEDAYYNSPNFSISGIQWFMQIYPNGRTSDNSIGWVSLYLRRHHDDESVSPVGASFSFGVWTTWRSVETIHREITWVYEDSQGYGYPRFLQRSELKRKRRLFLHSTALTLNCTLRVTRNLRSPNGLDSLSQDFVEMFFSSKGCDTILRVKEEEFPVHSCVLSARSHVFSSMFEDDIQEKRTSLVEIEDCDPWTFRDFLLYLYSGKTDIFAYNAFELYKIADKYDVEDLRSYCVLWILANISMENVLDAFTFGRQFRNTEVKFKSQKFFKENFPQIVESDKWKTFLKESTSVAIELLEDMLEKLNKTINKRIEASDAGASALSDTSLVP